MSEQNFSDLVPLDQSIVRKFEDSAGTWAETFLRKSPVRMSFDTARSGYTLPASLKAVSAELAASKPTLIDSVDLSVSYDHEDGQYEPESVIISFDNSWKLSYGDAQMITGQDDLFFLQSVWSAAKDKRRAFHDSLVPINTMYRLLDDCGLSLTLFEDPMNLDIDPARRMMAAEERHPDGLQAILPTIHAAEARSLSVKRALALNRLQTLAVSQTVFESDRYGLRQTEPNDGRIGSFAVSNSGVRPPQTEGLDDTSFLKDFTRDDTLTIRILNTSTKTPNDLNTTVYEAILKNASPTRDLYLHGLYKRIVSPSDLNAIDDVEPIPIAFDRSLIHQLSTGLQQAATN